MFHNYITTSNRLSKKLYQLIISRLDGEGIRSKSYQEEIVRLVEKGIGGFIIFGGKRDETRHFIDKIQSISEKHLFIASDIERGVGQQIQDANIFPCQMAMSAAIDKTSTEDVKLLQSTVKAIADEAKDIGINMPLIPVLDVNQDPDNPIICTRAFSDNPEDVAWFGSEYIKILESSGLVSCAKHFPGHGDTSIDSHILLPVINKSLGDLMDTDIMPFKKAIYKGVSSIMIGHLSIPAIDNKPASLSKTIVTSLLRRELGFNGLIMTDALNMNALKDIEKVPIQCINAGVDILLHPIDPDAVVEELISAVESKEITEEQIDRAVNRIEKKKVRLRNTERSEVNYEKHAKLSSQITHMSISLYKYTQGLLPISDHNEVNVICAGDSTLFQSSPLRSYFKNVSMLTDRIELNNKIPAFAIFTSVAAWKGSSGIDENEKDRIKELIRKNKHSVVISFGSPYVLKHFKEADILIAAYEAKEQTQRAVILCLEGRMDFKGHLPVKLNT